ncbi:hypothetical protein EON81_02920 [bacterium]|nr:MAG: hypothetical protein EON81_02920 [bacterium]
MPDRTEEGKFAKNTTVGKSTRWGRGQSGNPKGTKGYKVRLTYWVDKFLNMTDEELKEFKAKTTLTQAHKAAFRYVEITRDGSLEHFKHFTDRAEGPVRKEITGAGGEALFSGGKFDLTQMSDEEIATLKALVTKAAVEGENEDDPS